MLKTPLLRAGLFVALAVTALMVSKVSATDAKDGAGQGLTLAVAPP